MTSTRESTEAHWNEVCKPYADRLSEMFHGKGYIAVVDDERGCFIPIGARGFRADTLDEAFNAALPFARRYAAVIDGGATNEELYLHWEARSWRR